MTIKLYPFQEETVAGIEKFNGRVLVSLDMGLGKTVLTLAWLGRHPEALPALVVCPASLKWQWQNEAAKHLGWDARVLESRNARHLQPNHRLDIINYDILHAWKPQLAKLGYKTLVADEGHMLRNHTTQRTQAMSGLCDGVPHLLVLSGTPIVNRPVEFFPVLRMLRPDRFGAFLPFAMRYCAPRKAFGGNWIYDGAANLKELNTILEQTVMLRRRKEDVLKDLPPKTRVVVPLPLEDPGEYRRASQDFLSWARGYHGQKGFKALALVRLGHLRRLAAKLKLKFVLEWVANFLEETGEKLLLYAVHHAVLNACQERFPSVNVRVDGSVTGKHRQACFDRFNRDPACRLFLGNVQAAGVGWSCTSASHTAFAEMAWSPGEMTQAEDRTHGLKRGREGYVSFSHWLVGKDTVESKLCQVLQSKQQILSRVLDGKDEKSLDVFDQLTLALMQEGRQ